MSFLPFLNSIAAIRSATNYVKDYYLNALSPLLYKGSIWLGGQFADVRHFKLAMLYLAYAVFIAILGRLGWLLGGAALKFAVMAFTITAWIYIGLGFLGATPRLYAYPVIALILYALLRDRPWFLAVTTIVSGMLYPIVATIAGLCLASWLLVKPLSAQGSVALLARPAPLGNCRADRLFDTGWAATDVARQPALRRRVDAADIALYPRLGPIGLPRL